MAEYIDREQVLDYLTMIPIDLGYREIDDVKAFIESIPSADVQPVVHGHWVRRKTNIGLYQCSECHFPEHEQYGILGNYCRNCGARMDEDETTAL